jgi:SARP family transcriptional regulator, regulator of embCAB operon
MGGLMEIKILGSFDVQVMGSPVVPTAAKPRCVLAMLAVHTNRFVPNELVAFELWGTSPPQKAKAVIQTYILQIRKLIRKALERAGVKCSDTESKRILGTGPCGYILRTDAESDAARFASLTEAGHRAREQGDFPQASQCFTEALAIWRGGALADVQQGTHLAAERRRLEEMRLNALDCRIGSDLKIGRNHEVLGELTALASAHPTHEGLCAHLMLALYRSGRRSEALDVYRMLRSYLVTEAGLEPSPALQRLHRSMLTAERPSEEVNESWRTVTMQPRPAARGPVPRISAEAAVTPWAVGAMGS